MLLCAKISAIYEFYFGWNNLIFFFHSTSKNWISSFCHEWIRHERFVTHEVYLYLVFCYCTVAQSFSVNCHLDIISVKYQSKAHFWTKLMIVLADLRHNILELYLIYSFLNVLQFHFVLRLLLVNSQFIALFVHSGKISKKRSYFDKFSVMRRSMEFIKYNIW